MRHVQLKRLKARGLPIRNIGGSLARRSLFVVGLFIGAALLVAAVRAYNYSKLSGLRITKHSPVLPARDPSASSRGIVKSRLALQPEANKARHRLGQRFVGGGKERSVLIGALTIGAAEPKQIRIIRTQKWRYS